MSVPPAWPNYAPQPVNAPTPVWEPMTPKVDHYDEFEHELKGSDEFLTWWMEHAHFIAALAGHLEDFYFAIITQIFFRGKLIELWRKQSAAAGIDIEGDDDSGLKWMESLGRPNTTQVDGKMVTTKIADSMDWSAEGIHAAREETVEHLNAIAAHNHEIHVRKGWAHQDSTTNATWSQYGTHAPTQYDANGYPVQASYQFQPHAQGFAPYGMGTAPAGPVHGGHSNTGHATSGLLGKLIGAGATAAML